MLLVFQECCFKTGLVNLKADQILLFFNENFDQEDFYKMEASGIILIRNNEATNNWKFGNL